MIIKIGASKAWNKENLNYSRLHKDQTVNLIKETLEDALEMKANELVGEYGHFEVTSPTTHRTVNCDTFYHFIAEAEIDIVVVGHKIIVV